MKKIILILIMTLSSYIVKSQTIQSLNVSPNGTESVDVNLEIFYHQYIDYLGFDYEIVGNIININVCYWYSPANVPITDTRSFNIPVNNPINYTLNVIVYRSVDFSNCDYNSITDTATLPFTTPLTDTVYLGVEEFEEVTNQLIVFPNPVKDFLNINFSNNLAIKTIVVYNIFGSIVKTQITNFEQLDLSNFSNGMYFLKFNTNKGILQKKILVNN